MEGDAGLIRVTKFLTLIKEASRRFEEGFVGQEIVNCSRTLHCEGWESVYMDWSYKAYLLVDSEHFWSLERTSYFSVAAQCKLAAKHNK